MSDYVAHLSLPDGEFAREALGKIEDVAEKAWVTDSRATAVWLSWSTTADSREEAVFKLQEIRMRAEMIHGTSLFQGTPFIILRDGVEIVHSEEVVCV